MNKAPRKIRNKLLALPIYPQDLAVDFPQRAEAVFSCLALVPEFAEASGQVIKFRPFETIHLYHLANLRPGFRDGQPVFVGSSQI